MQYSPTLAKLYQALRQAREYPPAAFSGFGLAVETESGPDDTLKTTLRHRSGEWCSDEVTVLGTDEDAKAFSLTYICDSLLIAGAHVGAS